MSLLETKVLPKLEGAYEVTVKKYAEITNEKGGYIETILSFDDREFKYCIFPSQVDYVASCLRNQLNITEETTLGQLLELAKTNKITVYMSYNRDFNRYNLALHESVVNEDAITEM